MKLVNYTDIQGFLSIPIIILNTPIDLGVDCSSRFPVRTRTHKLIDLTDMVRRIGLRRTRHPL